MKNNDVDLFLLMFNISQIEDVKDISRIYIESMQEVYPSCKFTIRDQKDQSSNLSLPIQKGNNIFGYINIDGDISSLSSRDMALIRNSSGLLGVILQNREFSKALSEEASYLRKTVKENEKFLANLFQMVPEIIYIYDLDKQKNVLVNDTFEKLFGYTKTDLDKLGEGFLNILIHPDDIQNVINHHIALSQLEIGQMQDVEYRMKKKSGEWLWLISRDMVYSKSDAGNANQILGCATDITHIKETEHKLLQTIDDKNILLKEVHHRVKNNMSIITSFLELQSIHTEDEKLKTVLKESQNRIFTMALIHEDIYQSESFTDLNLKDYIMNLCSNIRSAFCSDDKKVEIKYNLININLEIDNIIPLGLLINEIITNAFKYAFQNEVSGIVGVNLRKENDIVFLEIYDNGPGLSNESKFENSKTLGFQIIKSLVTQINGKLDYHNNNGAHFLISFKIKN
jgi:PAS domain S-box-containing protein